MKRNKRIRLVTRSLGRRSAASVGPLAQLKSCARDPAGCNRMRRSESIVLSVQRLDGLWRLAQIVLLHRRCAACRCEPPAGRLAAATLEDRGCFSKLPFFLVGARTAAAMKRRCSHREATGAVCGDTALRVACLRATIPPEGLTE